MSFLSSLNKGLMITVESILIFFAKIFWHGIWVMAKESLS